MTSRRAAEDGAMAYAVVWIENGGFSYSGRLELETDRIVLSGSKAGWRWARRTLPYQDLAAPTLEHRASGRDMTQPILVLVTKDRSRIEIAARDGRRELHELAEQLERARGKAAVRIRQSADVPRRWTADAPLQPQIWR